MTWIIDDKALERACKLLKIILPVEIKQTTVEGKRWGCYSLRPVGGSVKIANHRVSNLSTATGLEHHITIKGYLSVDKANKVLWHELIHAWQYECVLPSTGSISTRWRLALEAVAASNKNIPYKLKPIETEARENSLYKDFSLVLDRPSIPC